MKNRINGSTDQRILISVVGWWFVLVLVGCDLTALVSPGVSRGSLAGAHQPFAHQPFADKYVSIDAGIVAAGRDGDLCLPPERVGLITDDDVLSVEISCSCVKARPVTVISADDSLRQATILPCLNEVRTLDACIDRAHAGGRVASNGDAASDGSPRQFCTYARNRPRA